MKILQIFAISSILLGGFAVGIPSDIEISGIPLFKMLMGLSTALNAVNLYLLKEEVATVEETEATSATET